ncbi:MAG: ferredoxin [Candidatus Woesearchaeota archaeon]
MAKYKISVNKEKCIGCGACTSVSDNFKLDESEDTPKAHPVKAEVDKIDKEKEAEEICPVDAIKVEEIE